MSVANSSDRPGRVAFLCTGHRWGGLEHQVVSIASGLRAEGHEVELLVRGGTPLARAARVRGLPTHATWVPWVPGVGRLLEAGPLIRWLLRFRPTVLHAHWSKDLPAAALATAAGFVPHLVFTEHMGTRRPKHDLVHRWIYGQVARVLAISRTTMERNLRVLPGVEDRIQVIYPGVDLSRQSSLESLSDADRRALRIRLGLAPDVLLVALVARISRFKGHRLLAEAMAPILRERSEVRLVFLGDASGRFGGEPFVARELEATLAELGIPDRVTWLGYRTNVPEHLACMDVAVVPSDDEAFGMAAVEAMAAGLALVISNSGALPEVVGDGGCGLAFRPGDRDSLETTLRRILDDAGLRRRMGEAARERAHAHFSLERHLEHLVSIYRDLAGASAFPHRGLPRIGSG